MSRTVELPQETVELLAEQAALRGLSVEEWIGMLAAPGRSDEGQRTMKSSAKEAIDGILAIQRRVTADTEGWTIRDYINFGRR